LFVGRSDNLLLAPVIEPCLCVQAVLGTFQKLVAGKAHDHEGFKLLQAVVEHVPADTMSKYLPEVRSTAPSYCKIALISRYVAKSIQL
jgi:hypothetical protein